MTQQHYEQHGVFHVTTNARFHVPWLTQYGIPYILLDNLRMTKNMHGASVYAFCLLPDHMHFLLMPGQTGLSAFVHSFKRNAMRDIRRHTHIHDSGRSRSSAGVVCGIPAVDCQWQKSFHSREIHSEAQRDATLSYVTYNAVRHCLVERIEDWPWTSLHFPNEIDHFSAL